MGRALGSWPGLGQPLVSRWSAVKAESSGCSAAFARAIISGAGPDGSIVRRTILGEKLLIAADEVGTPADSKRVFYFDLPLASAKQVVK